VRIQSQLGTTELDASQADAVVAGLNELYKALLEKQQIVQSVVIDGQSYYEGYNDHILNHMQSIREIVIHSVGEEQLMKEIRDELAAYLPKLIQGLDSISELFYGEMSNEDWGHFSQLTEGMQWTMQCVYGLRNYAERSPSYSALHGSLKQFEAFSERHLPELEAALEQKDYTAVGDQLKYEWPESFEELLEALQNA
jgi:hypothetical protein